MVICMVIAAFWKLRNLLAFKFHSNADNKYNKRFQRSNGQTSKTNKQRCETICFNMCFIVIFFFVLQLIKYWEAFLPEAKAIA